MKSSKVLDVVLAIVAIAAIVLCVVTFGQKNDLQKSVNDLTAQVESISAESDSLKSQVSDLQAQAEQSAAELAEAKSTIESTAAELAEAKSSLESTAAELTETKKTLESTAAELTETKTALEQAESDSLQARSALQETQEALQEMKDRIPSFTADIQLSANPEGVKALATATGALPENVSAIMDSIVTMVNNLSLHVVNVDKEYQLDALLKGQSVLSAAAKMTDDGLLVLSDLFPTSAVTLKNETIQQLTQNAATTVSNLDTQAIMNAVLPHLTKLTAELQAKTGEPEAVSYSFMDIEFTEKRPLNMTAKELSMLALSSMKDILQEEALQPLLSQVPGVSIDSLNESIANLENTAEEDMPAMTAATYSNESGAMLVEFALEKDGQSTSLQVAALENRVCLLAEQSQQAKIELDADAAAGKLSLKISANASGMPLELGLTLEGLDRNMSGNLSVGMNGTDLLGISFQVAKGGEITASFETDELSVIPFESIMQDGSGEEATHLSNDITGKGLQSLLTKAMKAMPAEIASLMKLFGTGK